ncbi:hypothetical protein SAMN05421790_104236 [Kroppenstedtia eburnea]|uniref:Uncharacterized protein n=1 Tax=Kroppenstedtia eburnea TaxID=714067 RepID=A0A1N7LKZ1_9BACL|nr:hypothetical protein SAMN05421790_104236 [Kroppenstedtia eburnea]
MATLLLRLNSSKKSGDTYKKVPSENESNFIHQIERSFSRGKMEERVSGAVSIATNAANKTNHRDLGSGKSRLQVSVT